MRSAGFKILYQFDVEITKTCIIDTDMSLLKTTERVKGHQLNGVQ